MMRNPRHSTKCAAVSAPADIGSVADFRSACSRSPLAQEIARSPVFWFSPRPRHHQLLDDSRQACTRHTVTRLDGKARSRARSYMKNYVPNLPNYVNNLKNLGWADAEFENGCSDKLVDAIVAWGTEKQIQDRIEAHLKAGATQVCIQPLHPDNDVHPDLKAVEAFARLNKPLRIDPQASTTKTI
jgi:alkanesulfonate monooxygenase SsuD/methylene tetrahydromethanopterin reductase-like flavin-dependent oxidoreductase (luciferase family)